MLKDAGQAEEVHLTAAMTIIRSRNIVREFTIRSTLLLKQTSYFVIRAAAFLLLLHSKLKKNVKEDKKIKVEFVRESLPEIWILLDFYVTCQVLNIVDMRLLVRSKPFLLLL